MRRTVFIVVSFMGVGVAGYALTYFFGIPFRFMDPHFFHVRYLLYPHVLGGAIALLTGPWQFSTRLRMKQPKLHRILGYAYCAAILLGGVFGLVLSTVSMGGLATHLGFGLLALAWISTTLIAVHHARHGDFVRHQDWTVRSFGLSLAAVSLRIFLPLLNLALPFLTAYAVVSWLCWIPNLALAEWMIASRRGLQPAESLPGVAR